MNKVFEDEFMELQSGLISLCLELTEGRVDKIFAYCSNEKDGKAFNAFFEVGGAIKTANQLNIPSTLIEQFLQIGTADLEMLDEICAKHGKPSPTELKLYYDARTGKFNADYKYETVCSPETEKTSFDVFMDWISEMRAAGKNVEQQQSTPKNMPKPSTEMGRSFVSRNILNGKGSIKWCFREKAVNELDNGWRFLSEVDTDDYLANPNNMVICDWSTVIGIEPAIMPIFNLPVGTKLTLEYRLFGKRFVDSRTGKVVSFK